MSKTKSSQSVLMLAYWWLWNLPRAESSTAAVCMQLCVSCPLEVSIPCSEKGRIQTVSIQLKNYYAKKKDKVCIKRIFSLKNEN